MYEKFYGFKDRPFSLTPDPDLFFASSKHEETLNRLLFAISERNGFTVITGEVGSGKTTVCRALLRQLDVTTKVALVFNTYLSRKELLTTILTDLGIEYKSTSKTHLLSALNQFLLEQLSRDVNVVLIIDEAQNLAPAVLEEVRMLSNLETEKEKLIQIVLIGQPQLREKLAHPKLEQFSQRIAMYYHLEALDHSETRDYIKHRLSKSGCKNEDMFSEEAIDRVYEYSNGIPRLINQACHSILIGGFLNETKEITEALVDEALEELMYSKRFSSAQKADDKIARLTKQIVNV